MKKYIKLILASIIFWSFFSSCRQITEENFVPEDKTPTAAVTELQVLSENGKITLTWKDPSDLDLFGVRIYTGLLTNEVPDYDKGITVEKAVQKYEATGLENSRTYIFKLTALDEKLNESLAVQSEKIVFYEKNPLINNGKFKIYHMLQKLESAENYELKDSEEDKELASNYRMEDIQKNYAGFTAKKLAVNENSVYVYYDRNTITYTLNTGNEGAFPDDSTSKTVEGLYGSLVILPSKPVAKNDSFIKWVDSDGETTAATFGAENKTYTALWKGSPEGFVTIATQTIVTSVKVIGSSFYYAKELYDLNYPVTIKGFYIGETEVTYKQWKEIYDWAINNGYTFVNEGQKGYSSNISENSENEPVTCISWRDCLVWCNAASEKEGFAPVYYYEGTTDFSDQSKIIKKSEGKINISAHDSFIGIYLVEAASALDKAVANENANGYRLPSEFEWEFAARGGDSTSEAWTYNFAGGDDLDKVGWFITNSRERTHEAGKKLPNSAGIYDMSGNVWEWCWTPATDDGSFTRYLRGGCWEDPFNYCYISTPESRSALSSSWAGKEAGFRIVRSM